MTHHVYGIRHHGPGSARAVREALQTLRPDKVLVEGPPDGSAMLPWLTHPELELPAALLIYRPDRPQRAAIYPFTTFSPELQAVKYALENDVPVQFADLPQANQLATESKAQAPASDPLIVMAKAAGFHSYEEWWNLTIEQRLNNSDLFSALLLLMRSMRESAGDLKRTHTTGDGPAVWASRREAAMRQRIRQAVNEGHRRIAFICGAWHAPALDDLGGEASDAALLDNLPQAEVEAAWVPWTYGRLSLTSGYGAGIRSPGWYQHLWIMSSQAASPREVAIGWLSQVAALLREAGFDASSAHVIQSVRLAEALASMRDLPFPGLPELNDATVTVLCGGDIEPMQLIQRKLIVGEHMGSVPAETPMVPLQRDLLRLQKHLGMSPQAETSVMILDLRQELDLERSQLLHRLNLLGIPWGQSKPMRSQQGASSEAWRLFWQPDFAVRIIEASIWGNTVEGAASQYVEEQAQQAAALSALTELLDKVILAGLSAAVGKIMLRIRDETALSSDIPQMMVALPPLARVLRYGSVRRTAENILQEVVSGLLTRICIGLPTTCASLDDEAAADMSNHFTAVNGALHTLRHEDLLQKWTGTMLIMVDQQNLHGMLAGRACRYLFDVSIFQIEEASQRMEQALRRSASAQSSIEETIQSAAWLEGFLHGSELLILHDRQLWKLLDSWVVTLGEKRFLDILPLLRKTFSGLSQAARAQLHDRVRYDSASPRAEILIAEEFNKELADGILPLIGQLLGLEEA